MKPPEVDQELFEARYAETILGGGAPCFYCGLAYNKADSGLLLCPSCNDIYNNTMQIHRVMCERVRERRGRFDREHEYFWSQNQRCAKCDGWDMRKKK